MGSGDFVRWNITGLVNECKGDGWRSFTPMGFRNQGDCVSFVATPGRNPALGK